jgi:hypothetical protein
MSELSLATRRPTTNSPYGLVNLVEDPHLSHINKHMSKIPNVYTQKKKLAIGEQNKIGSNSYNE